MYFAFNFDKMYHDSAYIDYEGELKVSIDMSALQALRKALSNRTKGHYKKWRKEYHCNRRQFNVAYPQI